jgi:hypothetical protein
MTIQSTAWAIGQAVPGTAKLVLVALANHAQHSTGRSFASIEDICKEESCAPRAAFPYLIPLQRNGYVARQITRGADSGKVRAFWLRFDRRPAPWVSNRHDAEDPEPAEASKREEAEPRSPLATGVPPGFRPAKQAAALKEAEQARKLQRIFVFEGWPAWIAWIDHRARTTGIRGLPTCWAVVDGQRRLGWWLPSLYPPQDTMPAHGIAHGAADAAATC